MEQKETIAQEALRLLEPIDSDEWVAGYFTNRKDKCCGLGHYGRLKSNDPEYYGSSEYWRTDMLVLKNEIQKFFKAPLTTLNRIDYAEEINNSNVSGKYTESECKDRFIHLLKDMVEAGY